MGRERDPVPMFEFVAFGHSLDLQRTKLEGWGPPGACAAQHERRRQPAGTARPRDYAVRTPRSSRAVRAVFSAVIPSFSRTSAPGALAPKRSIDTVRSTQRSHP